MEDERSGARFRRRGLIAIMFALAVVAPARVPEGEDEIARAQALLKGAREAIAGEEVWRNLRSLSAEGRLQTFVKYLSVQSPTKVEEKEKTLNGKVELDLLLPDKFRRRISTSTLRGFGISFAEVINGERAWRNPPPPVRSSHGDSRIIDVDDVERSYERTRHDVRQHAALHTLWLLGLTPPSFPVEFRAIGEYQLEDRTADVLLMIGPQEYRALLLLDHRTRLPLGVSFAFAGMRRETVLVEVASVSAQYIRETYARARREREVRRRGPQRRELFWRFGDHRRVGGLLLPHRLTTLLDGEAIEELVISQYRLNEEINPKRFEGEPKPRY